MFDEEARAVVQPAEWMIRCEHLGVDFAGRPAVADFSLTVRRGERVVLLGATGSGKSTILNVLVGAVRRTRGHVEVAGLDPERKWFELRGRFAIAFQDARLVPWRTALENVELGLRILGHSRAPRRQAAREWLARVHLADAMHLFPSQMSGGMQQRVSLARAFAVHPEVIFLDEAFSKLDEVTAEALRRDFRELAEASGVTSVIVTHDIDEALFLGTRVIVISKPARVLADRAVPGLASEMSDLRSDIVARLRGDNLRNLPTGGPEVEGSEPRVVLEDGTLGTIIRRFRGNRRHA